MPLRPSIASRLTSIRRRIPAIAVGVFLLFAGLSLGLTASTASRWHTCSYNFGDLVASPTPTANPASGTPAVPTPGPHVFRLHIAMAMVHRGDLTLGLQTMDFRDPDVHALLASQQVNLGWRFSSMFGGGNWWNAPTSVWNPPWEVKVLGFGFYKIKPPIDAAGITLNLPVLAAISLLAAAIAYRWRRIVSRRWTHGLCSRCGYSRDGLADAATCPECGAPPPSGAPAPATNASTAS